MTTFERKKIKKFNFFFMDAMKEVYEFNRSYMAYIKKFDIINTVYFSRFTVLYPIFPMPENKNLNTNKRNRSSLLYRTPMYKNILFIFFKLLLNLYDYSRRNLILIHEATSLIILVKKSFYIMTRIPTDDIPQRLDIKINRNSGNQFDYNEILWVFLNKIRNK